MPVLPFLRQRATQAADTRIIESRQLADAAQSLSEHARDLWRRYTPAIFRRDSDSVLCSHKFISACYAGLDAGPSPGAIVGITLGSIAGFLIVLYLLWILSNGTTFITTTALEVDEDVVVSSRRRSDRDTRRSQRSTYNAEVRRVSSPRRERVIRQERIVRDVPPPRRERESMRETTIIEESSSRRDDRRVDGDDVVEVFEEHSSISADPPPRRQSGRGSSYR